MYTEFIQFVAGTTGISPSSFIAVLISVCIALLLYRSAFGIIRFWGRRSKNRITALIDKSFYYPGLFLFILFAVIVNIPLLALHFPAYQISIVRQVCYLLTVFAFAMLAIRTINFSGHIIDHYFDDSIADNLRARKVKTRFQIIERVLDFMIIIIAMGIGLMSFEKIRAIGTTILSAAGILSVIIGFAAQKSIGTFIAGIQIAFTQPIRHDDVVIVENEWGRIEEITLTYIVVRIWDERRMVLPISYFLEKPFQNWTRTKADLLGTVFISADYNLPIDKVREELRRVVQASPLWDGHVCLLQVTNATEKTMELRALVSATDSSKAFDLRCDVREKLITYIQKNFPESLPKTRVEMLDWKEIEK